MHIGFNPVSNSGIADAIAFISKSNDFRTVYTWDIYGNVESIIYSSAKHGLVFLKRFTWDNNDNLVHVKLEDYSSPQSLTLIEGRVVGNDGRSFLEIPKNALLSPASIRIKTSINKRYSLSQSEEDYIAAVSIETNPDNLVAEGDLKFKFVFSTLRYLSPNSQVNLFMKINNTWENIGEGSVDSNGYLITANMRRL